MTMPLTRKKRAERYFVKVLPEEKFMEFMRQAGKVGGQHKFPRVSKRQSDEGLGNIPFSRETW